MAAVTQLVCTHITGAVGAASATRAEITEQFPPRPCDHALTRAHLQNNPLWGMRAFLVNLLQDRMCRKIFCAFQGYERIAMICFPLVKKFQPPSIPVTKMTAAASQLVCLFPSLLLSSHPFLYRRHCFHFSYCKGKNYFPLLSLPSNQTCSSFP